MQDQMAELVLERLRVGLGGEVAAFAAPARDGVHHARDHLLDAGLATRGAERAAEVLADHDVGRHLGPERRHLAVGLLENCFALLVGDRRGALLPRHLVVRVHALAREAPLHVQSRPLDLRRRRDAATASVAPSGGGGGWILGTGTGDRRVHGLSSSIGWALVGAVTWGKNGALAGRRPDLYLSRTPRFYHILGSARPGAPIS